MDMLKDETKFEVINLGVSGRTMMKTGDFPYWNEQAYQDALNSEADIVVMMLGTNDSKIFQWNRKQYHNDYIEMVKNMKNLPSKPEIYLMVPPPLYQDGAYQMQ